MIEHELRLRMNEAKRNWNITKDEKWIEIFYDTYQQLRDIERERQITRDLRDQGLKR